MAAEILAALQKTFYSNKTLSLAWRSAQLQALHRLVQENEAKCVPWIRLTGLLLHLASYRRFTFLS